MLWTVEIVEIVVVEFVVGVLLAAVEREELSLIGPVVRELILAPVIIVAELEELIVLNLLV